MKPPFSAMIVNCGAWVFLASRYETIARGDTDPTEQILELSYSRDKQAAINSSMVHEELVELARCCDIMPGVRAGMRLWAQVERNARLGASGLARRTWPSVSAGSAGEVSDRDFELRRCSLST